MLFLESLNRNPVIYNLDDRVLNSHESRENILFGIKIVHNIQNIRNIYFFMN